MDRNPPSKPEEQYPLLKVEGGAGDGGGHAQNIVPPTSPGWTVTCSPKQSWFSRWPELFSACWMTLVLLGISFLVFYALGMCAYRRHPLIVITCNNTKPASNVYYHHIIPRGAYVPFILYSEYIANMATRYPSLRFNVYFLVDDSFQSTLQNPKHGRFINKIISTSFVKQGYNSRLDENNKRQLSDFENKYENVNVTVIPLSKFMAITPLKYNWRSIPFAYLPFYARTFSVWQNGGIGIDLTTYNNLFNNNHQEDRRILAILKQHNDGIKPNEYTSALNTVDCDEETEILGLIYTLINQLLNQSRSFLNSSLSFSPATTEKTVTFNTTLKRNHRDKRDLSEIEVKKPKSGENSSAVHMELRNMTDEKIPNSLGKNFYQTFYDTSSTIKTIESNNIKINCTNNSQIDLNIQMVETKPPILKADKNSKVVGTNNSNVPNMLMFYDFSIFTDEIGPSYLMPEMILQPDLRVIPTRSEVIKSTTKHHKKTHFLTLDSDGTFIAASSRLHPFLGHLISSPYQYMHPTFAIKDTLLTQCSTVFRDDEYCSSIFLLK